MWSLTSTFAATANAVRNDRRDVKLVDVEPVASASTPMAWKPRSDRARARW